VGVLAGILKQGVSDEQGGGAQDTGMFFFFFLPLLPLHPKHSSTYMFFLVFAACHEFS
jgi:hypothetical protein